MTLSLISIIQVFRNYFKVTLNLFKEIIYQGLLKTIIHLQMIIVIIEHTLFEVNNKKQFKSDIIRKNEEN